MVAGTKFDQPGFGLRSADGRLTGLDVSVLEYVINSIADNRGWPHPTIRWRETPTSLRETLVQNNDVHIVAATYSITADRAQSVAFAGPYLRTQQALLVRAEEGAINSLEELSGRRLCSVTGSTSALAVKRQLTGVALQEYNTYSSCIDALHRGHVDALTTDAAVLSGFAVRSPGRYRMVPLDALGQNQGKEHYGIALRQGDEAGTHAVNSALRELLQTDAWNSMLSQHLGNAEYTQADTPGDLSFLE